MIREVHMPDIPSAILPKSVLLTGHHKAPAIRVSPRGGGVGSDGRGGRLRAAEHSL